MPKNNPIENVLYSFLKQLLGVGSKTSTVGILLETGNIPLSLNAQKACIKNWERIAIKGMCNNLIQISYKSSVESNLAWPTRIRNILSHIGMQDIFIFGNNTNRNIGNLFFHRVTDIFYQNSFAVINSEHSKLGT